MTLLDRLYRLIRNLESEERRDDIVPGDDDFQDGVKAGIRAKRREMLDELYEVVDR